MNGLDVEIQRFEALKADSNRPKPVESDTADADWPVTLDESHFSLYAEEIQGPTDHHPRQILRCAFMLPCSRCVGGYEFTDDLGSFPCRCYEGRRRAKEVTRSGLPPVARNHIRTRFDLKRYKNPGDVGAALRAGAEGQGLMMHGPIGSGKTMGAQAIAIHHALVKGRRIAYRQWPMLIQDMQSTFNANGSGPTVESVLRPLNRAQTLVLDEIGGNKATEWATGQLRDVLTRAVDEENTVIATTNLSPYDVVEFLGARIASRLKTLCRDIHMESNDSR